MLQQTASAAVCHQSLGRVQVEQSLGHSGPRNTPDPSTTVGHCVTNKSHCRLSRWAGHFFSWLAEVLPTVRRSGHDPWPQCPIATKFPQLWPATGSRGKAHPSKFICFSSFSNFAAALAALRWSSWRTQTHRQRLDLQAAASLFLISWPMAPSRFRRVDKLQARAMLSISVS